MGVAVEGALFAGFEAANAGSVLGPSAVVNASVIAIDFCMADFNFLIISFSPMPLRTTPPRDALLTFGARAPVSGCGDGEKTYLPNVALRLQKDEMKVK